jgi:hypothetical protein
MATAMVKTYDELIDAQEDHPPLHPPAGRCTIAN